MNTSQPQQPNEVVTKLDEEAATKLAAMWRGYAARQMPRGRKRSAEAICQAPKRRKYLTMDPAEGLTFRKYAGMSADEIEAAPMEEFGIGDTVKVFDWPLKSM